MKPETDILPIGPLMIEHRLIERVVTLLEKELARIREGNQVNAFFLTSAIDFFKVYADRCHHGKEEDILFDDLQKKMLSPEDKTMIENLK
ncbi:MAG: hemerythrin, partial [Candidatus Omnitrophica bacterium]|nr:hemerythrin [Candidatus Omnitrophota bacterium]